MNFSEAKKQFIQTWGALGTSWGINKTMAQIFALLMISTKPLSVEEIMEELSISRGNTSMNIRTLIDWELVMKSTKMGERKEYFECDGDIWDLSRKVAENRKNREVSPVLKVLERVSNIEDEENEGTEELNKFKEVTKELKHVVTTTDTALTHFINSKRSWVSKTVLQFLKK